MSRIAEFMRKLANRLKPRPPVYRAEIVEAAPAQGEMRHGIIYTERRHGVFKWAHFLCPQCSEEIRIPIGHSRGYWRLSIDKHGRPTLQPSVWQTGGCGAHFFVRGGNVLWSKHERSRAADHHAGRRR